MIYRRWNVSRIDEMKEKKGHCGLMENVTYDTWQDLRLCRNTYVYAEEYMSNSKLLVTRVSTPRQEYGDDTWNLAQLASIAGQRRAGGCSLYAFAHSEAAFVLC